MKTELYDDEEGHLIFTLCSFAELMDERGVHELLRTFKDLFGTHYEDLCKAIQGIDNAKAAGLLLTHPNKR